MKLTGPFSQIITMQGLPPKGALADDLLYCIPNGGVLWENGFVVSVGDFNELRRSYPQAEADEINRAAVLLPGFIDCHTHICFGGTRNNDYALRIAGSSYLDIARSGGGIWSSVMQTRSAPREELTEGLLHRIARHASEGVTTIEIKSGYGLNPDQELKMLRAIQAAAARTPVTLVPTCLAAHTKPRDFEGSNTAYLHYLQEALLPAVKLEGLARRVDIFIEETAFSAAEAMPYLQACRQMGFDITIHADQFTASGSEVAVQTGAVSADHLEASGDLEIQLLAASSTVAVALPGASMGLGMQYAPARRLLDAGASLAISTDWNPGSAPMGDLLLQAAVLGAAEKLTTTETLAAITVRAAAALRLQDRGVLAAGMRAQMQAYPTADYRDILYYQGKMKPYRVWA